MTRMPSLNQVQEPVRFSAGLTSLELSYTALNTNFLTQLKVGVTGVSNSFWSPLNRISFGSTYQLTPHRYIDGWIEGVNRKGYTFASPICADNRHDTETVIQALGYSDLVGPYDGAEIADWVSQPSFHAYHNRADADYVLDCDELVRAEGSKFSRWRRYLRIASSTDIERKDLSTMTSDQLLELLTGWVGENPRGRIDSFDLQEMKDAFTMRSWSTNIAGFCYFRNGQVVGATLCDLSVEGVVNLLFMKTTKSVRFLSRLAIHDVAAELGRGMILNMGQDLDLPGLRIFKTQLPNSELMDKFYLSKNPLQATTFPLERQ